MTAPRKGDWMQTFTGLQFWPLDPCPEEVRIEDIAHSLANQCRFAGHCRTFYSVAQHSVLVSREVERMVHSQAGATIDFTHLRWASLWGLLHDASEAYLVDVPRPVKPHLGGYHEAEARVQMVVCERFGLPLMPPEEVKQADERLLATEARDLMAAPPEAWAPMPTPLPDHVVPLWPQDAEMLFLRRFRLLTEAIAKQPGGAPA